MKEILKNIKIQITELNSHINSDESWRDLKERGMAIVLRNHLIDFVEKYELMGK
jgi:hypothetical protein